MNLKNEIKIILYITMVAVLIICILMFGLNEVWSFHDAVVTSNNRTSEDIHPSDKAKLLSNFPSHDRKDNIITELHSEPENTLSSITQLLLQNPGAIPGGAIELEANAINNIIHPKISLKTNNKTATAKGYVINSPRKTASPSVNNALSLNIVDEGIDLEQGHDNTMRKTQRLDGSVNHLRSDPTNNMIATERNDFYIDDAKETETRFHNLLKTGKTDKPFISTHRVLADDKIQFKVGTEKITPIPHQVQLMTSQKQYEITTKSTQNNNSEIDGIVKHAITNSFHRTDIGDKDDTISEKSVIDTHHSNIDDLLKYRKLTSAVPLNVARLERLTRVDSRNLTQNIKLTSSIPVISTATKTVPRREIKQEQSYSDGHKYSKNNVGTTKETRDNYNVTGKEKNDNSYSDGHKHNKNNVSTLKETRDNANVTGKEKNDNSYSVGHKHNKNNISTLKETRDNVNVTGKDRNNHSYSDGHKHNRYNVRTLKKTRDNYNVTGKTKNDHSYSDGHKHNKNNVSTLKGTRDNSNVTGKDRNNHSYPDGHKHHKYNVRTLKKTRDNYNVTGKEKNDHSYSDDHKHNKNNVRTLKKTRENYNVTGKEKNYHSYSDGHKHNKNNVSTLKETRDNYNVTGKETNYHIYSDGHKHNKNNISKLKETRDNSNVTGKERNDHNYSDGHKHNKNNVRTVKETRDNSNVTGKEKNYSSKFSSRKHKNHTKVSHIQNKIMKRKIIKDSRMNKTSMLPQGSDSKNSILEKMESKVSKIQRLSPSVKTEKSNTHKALSDTSVVTSKRRKRRRRKYKNESRQSSFKNYTIAYEANNKTVHLVKENTTSEHNLTSETIIKHISKPILLSSDHSNQNLTRMFELEKKPIQRQNVNISRGREIDKENVTRKPGPVSKRIGKIVSLHFNKSKLEITSQNSNNKTIVISTTQQPIIIGSTNKQTFMANKTEQAKVQKHDLKIKDVNGNENKDMNGNKNIDMNKYGNKDVNRNENKDVNRNENKDMKRNKNKEVNRNENKEENRNENKDVNRNENKEVNRNAIRINQSKLEITSQNSDNKTIIISTTQQPMSIQSTHKQTDMANESLYEKTEQAMVQKHDLNVNENKDMNGNKNIDMNGNKNIDTNGNKNKDMYENKNKVMYGNRNKDLHGNASAIRITKRNMNDTQGNNNNVTANDFNKTHILVKLSKVQVTGIPIPFRRYSKLTTSSYRTTTVFNAKETNKEPVSMSKSFYSTSIPATKMSNSDINGRNKTAHLENIKIHENENDHMTTGDQRDRNNITDNAFNRPELLSTITTVKTHTKNIPKSNGPKSTHSNNSSQIIDKESLFVDNTGQGNPWDQWLGSLSTNDKYPLQIEPRFENKTKIVVPVQNSAIIHNKWESNLTSTSSTLDFPNSPQMHSDVSNKYETTTAENIDTFNNLDYHTFVGKSEVVTDKQATNVSKISDSTSKSQADLLTKWNTLLQQFRKDNARKKSKLVQLLQNKSKSKTLKERHDVRFQKKPTSKNKNVKPTVEWLGIYKDLIKEQDKNVIPVSNKHLHHSSHSSLHDGNVHSQFVGEQLKTSCKEDQSYKLALNVLQTILMNMNNIKLPVPKKAHKRRYLLIPLGPEKPEPTQSWTDNEYNNHHPNTLMEERNIYPSDGRIPYRIRPQNPSVHMSVHSSF
ncbi:probable cyclin-dependent serine/threonine-protein kinase DDB_G0292550 isoform X2 [Mytilus trossulus]|uniref:probable cyclin-dependent serine/threonine-protein kinase DDB_G0292550 isoform X2 n=1 Tax=Mytilus trossulus TaxID=6551 RepID=UPI003003C9AE